jgi:hypothetical protein
MTLSQSAVDKIKALYAPKEEAKVKPKAFIVKKQKPKEEEAQEAPVEPVKEVPRTKSRLEIVRQAPSRTMQQKPKEAPREERPQAPKRTFQTRLEKRPLYPERPAKPEIEDKKHLKKK